MKNGYDMALDHAIVVIRNRFLISIIRIVHVHAKVILGGIHNCLLITTDSCYSVTSMVIYMNT